MVGIFEFLNSTKKPPNNQVHQGKGKNNPLKEIIPRNIILTPPAFCFHWALSIHIPYSWEMLFILFYKNSNNVNNNYNHYNIIIIYYRNRIIIQ